LCLSYVSFVLTVTVFSAIFNSRAKIPLAFPKI
jgi:hypothetical protein